MLIGVNASNTTSYGAGLFKPFAKPILHSPPLLLRTHLNLRPTHTNSTSQVQSPTSSRLTLIGFPTEVIAWIMKMVSVWLVGFII